MNVRKYAPLTPCPGAAFDLNLCSRASVFDILSRRFKLFLHRPLGLAPCRLSTPPNLLCSPSFHYPRPILASWIPPANLIMPSRHAGSTPELTPLILPAFVSEMPCVGSTRSPWTFIETFGACLDRGARKKKKGRIRGKKGRNHDGRVVHTLSAVFIFKTLLFTAAPIKITLSSRRYSASLFTLVVIKKHPLFILKIIYNSSSKGIVLNLNLIF